MAREVVAYGRADTIFSQGDAADSVLYIHKGGVKLSVVSKVNNSLLTVVLHD